MKEPDVQKIGKYEIQAELGRGGFGRVYRAFDPTVGRPVAIKILTTEASKDVLTRFRNEAAAAGNLRHRNIVTVYEFGEYNDRPYMVMELLEGEDLQQVIKSGRELTLLYKMNIMDQVADGLDCAHRNGVVHRDVKPANIQILSDGTVKIMDFGIARVQRDQDTHRLTQQGDLVGTILYMSPEQFGGGEADALCDIFAYGVTYYELLAGKHPFRAADPRAVMFKITMEDAGSIRTLTPDCPEALEEVLRRAMQKDRELRYQSLRDLKLDAEPILMELRHGRASELTEEAQELSRRHETQKALALVNEALDLDATNRDARQLRDVIQRQVHKEALQPKIEALIEAAHEQLAKRLFPQAIQTLETAQKLDQTEPRIRSLLDSAREQSQRAKDSARMSVAALDELERRQWRAAAQKCAEALRLDSTNRDAARAQAAIDRHVEAGLDEADVHITKGDLDKAIQLLHGLSEIRPDFPGVRRRLAQALSKQSVEGRAGGMSEQAQRERQNGIDELARDCERLAGEGRFSPALEALRDGLQKFGQEPALLKLQKQVQDQWAGKQRVEAIHQLEEEARAFLKQDQPNRAVDLLERASSEYPEEEGLRQLLGDARKALERRAHAVQTKLEESRRPASWWRPRLIGIVLGGVAILAAVVAAMRVLKGPGNAAVSISANVSGASVTVGGKSCTTPDCVLELPFGSYTLAATKEGYRPLGQPVSLSRDGARATVPLTFEPLPQIVQITTNFSRGSVVLDGKPAGDLRDGQLRLTDIPPGDHQVRVTGSEGHFEIAWRSQAGSAPQLAGPVTAKGLLATVIASVGERATIACNCDPRTIQVDGHAPDDPAPSGQGLSVRNLKEGSRRVTASDRSLIVDMRPNPLLNVFLSSPPLHKVAVSKGEEERATVAPTPMPSMLEIAGTQPGAQVKVDGRVVGATGANGALRIEVGPGDHQIEITKEDYTAARFTAQFNPGKTTHPAREQVAMSRITTAVDPRQVEAQAWDRVRNSNSVDELEDFVRKHPGGAHADDARTRVSQLRQQAQAAAARQAEQSAWDATDKSKKASLQDYLNRFGAGAHAQEARGLLADLEKRDSEAAAAVAATKKLLEDQDRAKRQTLTEPQRQAQAREIRFTFFQFNTHFVRRQWRDLAKIWPNPPQVYKEAMSEKGSTFVMALNPTGDPEIAGDTASVPCELVIQTRVRGESKPQQQAVRVVLHHRGAQWIIADMRESK